MNIGIIFAFCRYCIQWEKQSIQLIFPKLIINCQLILFGLVILLYIVPFPQSFIQILSSESSKMNALSQSPMDIVNRVPLQWGTLAVTNYPVRHAWVQYMVYLLFFWGLLLVLNQEKKIKQLCLLLIGIGLTESLYGLSQTFVDSGYILWVPKAVFENRHDTCGTLINRNHFGALMTMLMIFCMAYSASQTDRKKISTRHTSFKRKLARFLTNEYQWNQKIIGITSASIMGLAIYFSSSRGAVIALFPGIVVLIVAFSSRKNTKKQALLMILVGLIILVSTVKIENDRLIQRFHAIQRAMESRMRYVHSTIDLISDYAILGVGPANFTHAFARYQSSKDQQVTVTHTHNDWLQFVSEMGVVGLALLLIIISSFIWKILYQFRKRKSPSARCLGIAPIAVFASISAHSLFDFPLHIPGNMLILIAICVVGFQALHVIHYKKQSKILLEYVKIPFTVRHIGIWIIFLIVLISMTLLSTCHFIAESYCNTIPNSTLNRNQNPEKEAIQKAIFWDPGNPVHWYKIAWQHIAYRNSFAETNNSIDWVSIQKKVIYALEQAVANNPCEAEYHIRLAWEYHHMQHHENGNQKRKRIEASDIAMKHAAIVCGDKSFTKHMEIANFWNMRSATHSNLAKQKTFWKLAFAHYRKALTLSSGRCKERIIKQLKLYRRHENHFHDVFNKSY
jgi:O-antigen ligase